LTENTPRSLLALTLKCCGLTGQKFIHLDQALAKFLRLALHVLLGFEQIRFGSQSLGDLLQPAV
jgi:hypothetical protein